MLVAAEAEGQDPVTCLEQCRANRAHVHTTNYQNAFTLVAEDCKVTEGKFPPRKASSDSIANLEYELVGCNPYTYISDDVKFTVHARRKGIAKSDTRSERDRFFSKGQPCFRASPLTKSYGWGVHAAADGTIVLHGMETAEYAAFVADDSIRKYHAMRSKRA